MIQASQILFMAVSAAWGVLFLTGTLQVWSACVLLVLHGLAGSLWGPAEQLMLHDFVGDEELPSAVRLNATFRSLGVLFGVTCDHKRSSPRVWTISYERRDGITGSSRLHSVEVALRSQFPFDRISVGAARRLAGGVFQRGPAPVKLIP